MESGYLQVTSGVLQGSILGPLLFKLFINDLLDASYENLLCAFADDIKLFGIVDLTKSLQADLDCVQLWCTDNRMFLNVEKCKVIHFGSRNPRFNYNLKGSVIDSVSSQKDLGLVIDC